MNQTATVYLRARGNLGSIEWQRAMCRQAADRLGATIIAEYVEEDAGHRRPVLDAMLHDLAGSEATDLFVVASADRLTRRMEIWHRLGKRLTRAGVRLVTADLVGRGDNEHLRLDALIHYVAKGQRRV